MEKNNFYGVAMASREWTETKEKKLKQTPFCELCEAKGVQTIATEVEHKTPVRSTKNPRTQKQLMFDLLNLQSLCLDCKKAKNLKQWEQTKEAKKKQLLPDAVDFIRRYFGNKSIKRD